MKKQQKIFLTLITLAIFALGAMLLIKYNKSLSILSLDPACNSENVPTVLGAALQALCVANQDTPIFLPDELPPSIAHRAAVARVESTDTGYLIVIESSVDCDGANACFLGLISAERGAMLSLPEQIEIDNRVDGRFQPSALEALAGSSPAMIEWSREGVLYTIQLRLDYENNLDHRQVLRNVARSALRIGPR